MTTLAGCGSALSLSLSPAPARHADDRGPAAHGLADSGRVGVRPNNKSSKLISRPKSFAFGTGTGAQRIQHTHKDTCEHTYKRAQ